MLGARKRVAGNEMHGFGQMRLHGVDHRPLDRADIRDGGAGGQMRRDLGGDVAHDAHRHGQNDQIGALHGLGGGVADPVDQPDLERGLPRLG